MKYKLLIFTIIFIIIVGFVSPVKRLVRLFNTSTEQVVRNSFFYIRTYEGYDSAKKFIGIIKQGKLLIKKETRKRFIDLYGSSVWNKYFSKDDFDDNERRAIGGSVDRKGDWYFYLRETSLENLSSINIEIYRADLSEQNYKNFKYAKTIIQSILAKGLNSTEPDNRNHEIRLKMAILGVSPTGRKLPIEFSLAALLQSRLDVAQSMLKKQIKSQSVTDEQNKIILKRLLAPVHIDAFLFDRVLPAGAVNEKLLDGNRLYVRQDDVPESVEKQALGIIANNKSKKISNSKMLELAANILVFGYKDGAKRWLRINNYSDIQIPALQS